MINQPDRTEIRDKQHTHIPFPTNSRLVCQLADTQSLLHLSSELQSPYSNYDTHRTCIEHFCIISLQHHRPGLHVFSIHLFFDVISLKITFDSLFNYFLSTSSSFSLNLDFYLLFGWFFPVPFSYSYWFCFWW
jgi:hypothetical protein